MSEPDQHPADVTLFDASFGATHALTVDALPTAEGRWQPVRAGVVNSWAWVDEQFLFSNGWCALVGPNGSGKSLTSGQWFPTMIDGDTSPAALSMSQRGAGNLADRHHNRSPGREKTGVWWLEFGFRAPDGALRWTTLGLWIRWRGDKAGTLDRVWFIVAGRVGADLHLHTDGTPVDFDGLCQQIASCQGQIFVKPNLQRAAGRYLAVNDEPAYAEAVRTQLFPGTDRDQMTALTTVLRALRSVRVNDRMTAGEMHSLLTAALPALSSRYVELLAKNLAQSDDLLNKATTAKQEHELLTKLSGLYRSYADTAAASTGHTLLAAAAEVKRVEAAADKLTRDTAATNRRLEEAGEAKQKAEQRLDELKVTGDLLQRRTDGHPGSHLPELATAVDAAHQTAELATGTANERRAEADTANKAEQKAVESFHSDARQLTNVTATLREHAGRAAAEAFCEPFHAATTALTRDLGEATTVAESDLPQLAEPVKTWIQHRERVIGQTRKALDKVTTREEAEADADGKHDTAVGELDTAEREQRAHQQEVSGHHDVAVGRLRAFGAEHAAVLGAVPVPLLASVPLDPDAVDTWADQALTDALTKIDLAGATATANKATDAADQAATRLSEAQQAAERAAAGVRQVADDLQDTITRVPRPPQAVTGWIAAVHAVDIDADVSFEALPQCDAALQDASDRREALRGAVQALNTAQGLDARAAADAHAAAATAAKLQKAIDLHQQQLAGRDAAVTEFVRQVTRWTSGLQVLTLHPHEIPGEADARDGDLSAFQIHLITAVRRAEAALRDELEPAQRAARDLAEQLSALDAKITEAETEEKLPDAPSWRADRSDRCGAPLWALIDFAPDIDARQRAAIEGALISGGILDAWVDADTTAIAGDWLLRPGSPVPGRSLADVLVAQPTDTISAEHITGILHQIAYDGPHRGGGITLAGEQIRTDWVTAAAPADWQPQYIGAAARAEQRRRLLDSLRRRRVTLAEQTDEAQARVALIEGRFVTLTAEAKLPDFDDVTRQRVTLAQTQLALSIAEATHDAADTRAGESHQEAQTGRRLAAEACDLACAPTDPQAVADAAAACAGLVQQLHTSRNRAETLAGALAERATRADQQVVADQAAAAAAKAAEDAQRRHDQARTSRAALRPFDELRAAITGLREADRVVEQASATEAAARTELQRCRAETVEARRRLTAAATTKDGRRLPLDERQLEEFDQDVRRLARTVESWISNAQRLFYLRGAAQAAREAAGTASTRAAKAAEIARGKQNHAKTQQHKLDEERRLHEKSFQDLLDEHQRNGEEQQQARAAVTQHDADIRTNTTEAARLEERATTLTASLEQARRGYDDAQDRLVELFDYELIGDVTDGAAYERPGVLDAATAVARRLVRDFPAATVCDQLRQQSAKLNMELRNLAPVFIRMGRLVTEEEFGTGSLRRIVVSDSDTTLDTAAPARPLRQAVADIGRRLQALQRDYDDQLRTEIKGALFTQLRAQIVARIEQAQQIVAGISATLTDVRTGVERVGVRLAWVERRDDPIAQEALSHIQGPNLDGNFDDMYEFFIACLRDDTTNEPASERIARVFDYRTWFTWRVEVTHRSFSDETHPNEVFREITLRKNPLDSLSTGEKRLASMLPLLAAVKSFYSTPGFTGPRMAFVDELDAALDQTNLRTLLALLRDWDLDVLATLPTMGKLLVPEVQTTAIHKITKNPSGVRFSVPYIWRGSGLPDAVRIAIPEQRSLRATDGMGDLQ